MGKTKFAPKTTLRSTAGLSTSTASSDKQGKSIHSTPSLALRHTVSLDPHNYAAHSRQDQALSLPSGDATPVERSQSVPLPQLVPHTQSQTLYGPRDALDEPTPEFRLTAKQTESWWDHVAFAPGSTVADSACRQLSLSLPGFPTQIRKPKEHLFSEHFHPHTISLPASPPLGKRSMDVSNRLASTLRSDIPDSLIPPSRHVTATVPIYSNLAGPTDELLYDSEKRRWVQKTFPSLKPAGRREVQMLTKMLDDKLAQNHQHAEGIIDIFVEDQRVYDLVFSELVRQVSVQCADRGILLQRVWDAHSDMILKLLRELDTREEKFDNEMFKANTEIRRLRAELDGFMTGKENMTTAVESFSEVLADKDRHLGWTQEKLAKLEEQLFIVQAKHDDMESNYDALNQEVFLQTKRHDLLYQEVLRVLPSFDKYRSNNALLEGLDKESGCINTEPAKRMSSSWMALMSDGHRLYSAIHLKDNWQVRYEREVQEKQRAYDNLQQSMMDKLLVEKSCLELQTKVKDAQKLLDDYVSGKVDKKIIDKFVKTDFSKGGGDAGRTTATKFTQTAFEEDMKKEMLGFQPRDYLESLQKYRKVDKPLSRPELCKQILLLYRDKYTLDILDNKKGVSRTGLLYRMAALNLATAGSKGKADQAAAHMLKSVEDHKDSSLRVLQFSRFIAAENPLPEPACEVYLQALFFFLDNPNIAKPETDDTPVLAALTFCDSALKAALPYLQQPDRMLLWERLQTVMVVDKDGVRMPNLSLAEKKVTFHTYIVIQGLGGTGIALQRGFGLLDKQGTGQVSRDVFVQGCLQQKIEVSTEDLESVAQRLSLDGGGVIELADLVKFSRSYSLKAEVEDFLQLVVNLWGELDVRFQQSVESAYTAADAVGDGSFGLEEFQHLCAAVLGTQPPIEMVVRMMIDGMETSSGRFTYETFLQACYLYHFPLKQAQVAVGVTEIHW